MSHAPLIVNLFKTRAIWGLVLLALGLFRAYGQRSQRDRALEARFGKQNAPTDSAVSAAGVSTFARLVDGIGRHLKSDLSGATPDTRVGSLCGPGSPTRGLMRSVERDFRCRLPPSHELVSMTLGDLASLVERSVDGAQRRG